MPTPSNGKFEKNPQHHPPKPREKPKWVSIRDAIYNPSTQKLLGRTSKSWFQLFVFYTIFYSCLAGFYAVCMQALLATLNDTTPTWTLAKSRIGTNPGLGFRPLPKFTENGSLIWYNLEQTSSSDMWVQLIDEFLQPYQSQQHAKNCSYRSTGESTVCSVRLDHLGACSAEQRYGYNSPSPCVFLKLNRIIDWLPDVFTTHTPDMPRDLQDAIEQSRRNNATNIWVSCAGERPADQERIGGFRFYPTQGFPTFYYPYKNSKNYLSPIIAVQLLNVTQDVIISVECRAWAKNILYHGGDKDRQGSVQFEILIDSHS